MAIADRHSTAGIALGILLAWCPCACALNPSLDINQYAHNSWTVRDGFFKSAISRIAQTPDGYLWLGTDFGLLRFDGVRAVVWQPPAGDRLPDEEIGALLAARDGRLWIGTRRGLASWRDGKLTHYPQVAGQAIPALLEDREGTVWAATAAFPTARLCSFRAGRAQCYGDDGSFGSGVFSLYEDGGVLWLGAVTGLWRWTPGPPKRYPTPDAVSEIHALIAAGPGGKSGELLFTSLGGMRKLVDGTIESYSLSSSPSGMGRQFNPNRLLRDRNGGLWLGTSEHGLLHEYQGRADGFTSVEGLSGDRIRDLFEDREGNVWVATEDGIDRFRDFAVPTISAKQGLSAATVWSVLAAADGSVWLGTPDGLNRWTNRQVTTYRNPSGLPRGADSLYQDARGRIWVSTRRGLYYIEDGRFTSVSAVTGGFVNSIAGGSAGDLWISNAELGLVHLVGGDPAEQIPRSRLGIKEYTWSLLPDPERGGLWIGYNGGLNYFKGGQVRASYSTANGLGEGRVVDLQLDRDGTLWAATQGGLSRLRDGRIVTLTTSNGLPCNTIQWAVEDNDHSFWLFTACGLVRIARTELNAWLADSKRMIRSTVFDNSDGARGRPVPGGYTPRASKSADGKLWFTNTGGVGMIDPRHLAVNKLPPPVHIEQITADRKTWWENLSGDASLKVRLPPLVRDLEIDYTALSFAAPEKVRFKYKLEGEDSDWIDAGNRRRVFYTNLSPRNYRFRVAACNNSGVWNDAGAFLDFSIAPAYYQTRWFQVLCGAVFLALLWAVYEYRLRRVAREFNVRLEERVNERTRIAGELHDTLLQSFQGLLFFFHAARDLMPARPDEAVTVLEKALDRAHQAIAEGRNAIQDIRSSTVATNDLSQAMAVLGEEMSHESASGDSAPNPAKFDVLVEGTPRNLHPILRDEIYRIAREAVKNAFRHAHASRIEAEITYDDRALRLRIRDNGCGMEARIVEEGLSGHYGLPGMRERAIRTGGELKFWSAVGAGTEIELSIPGPVAYGTSRARRVLGLFRRKADRTHGLT